MAIIFPINRIHNCKNSNLSDEHQAGGKNG